MFETWKKCQPLTGALWTSCLPNFGSETDIDHIPVGTCVYIITRRGGKTPQTSVLDMTLNNLIKSNAGMQKRMECFRLLFDALARKEHQFLSGIRDSRKAGSL